MKRGNQFPMPLNLSWLWGCSIFSPTRQKWWLWRPLEKTCSSHFHGRRAQAPGQDFRLPSWRRPGASRGTPVNRLLHQRSRHGGEAIWMFLPRSCHYSQCHVQREEPSLLSPVQTADLVVVVVLKHRILCFIKMKQVCMTSQTKLTFKVLNSSFSAQV